MGSIEDAKRLASMLLIARKKSGLSQEEMAMALGVSKNTIYNFEKGTSCPTLTQLMSWYNAAEINPTRDILHYCNPDEFFDIEEESTVDLKDSLHALIEELSLEQQKGIMYLLCGSYRGDPLAMIQLFIAHAHLPIDYRFSIAKTICETYKLCEHAGTLRETDKIMPNIHALENAIEKGRNAAINKQDGY